MIRRHLAKLREAYNFPQQISSGFDRALAAAPGQGLLLEFGVASGASFVQLCTIAFPRKVYGFDWFYGLPEFWNSDNPKGKFSTNGVPPSVPQNGEIYIGMVQDTLDGFLECHLDPVAFVHFDLDLYSSTKFVLDRIEPRVIDGTVFLFDEIIGNPDHEERAFVEFLENTGLDFEVVTRRNKDAIAFRIRK